MLAGKNKLWWLLAAGLLAAAYAAFGSTTRKVPPWRKLRPPR